MRNPGRGQLKQRRVKRAGSACSLAVVVAVAVAWMSLIYNAGGHSNAVAASADNGTPANSDRVRAWFERYDSIRRCAQMTPAERKTADGLMDKKIILLMPGFGRFAAQRLLKKMIDRYEAAAAAMKELPPVPETRELHEGYTRYFATSRELFHNTLRTLNNPLRSKKELEERKAEVAELDETLKTTDKQLRDTYNIPPYTYKTAASS